MSIQDFIKNNSKKLRIFGIAVGAFFFAWFLVVAVFVLGLNAGNAGGMMLSVAVILILSFLDELKLLIKSVSKKRLGKLFLKIIAAILAVAILAVCCVSCCVVFAPCHSVEEPCTAVVLGCLVKPNGPSLMLRERLEAALEWLEEHPNSCCVVSGGRGDDEHISEAQCMYNWLVERGVSPERIYIEDKSTSTRENISFSMEIIRENGLPERIAIVTNEFHECRAMIIARKMGVECGAVPGKTIAFLYPTYFIRDVCGVFYEILS